jgi:hypothetical protein
MHQKRDSRKPCNVHQKRAKNSGVNGHLQSYMYCFATFVSWDVHDLWVETCDMCLCDERLVLMWFIWYTYYFRLHDIVVKLVCTMYVMRKSLLMFNY